MAISTGSDSAISVETRMFRQARVVGVVGRNVAFLLVSLVYLSQPGRSFTGIAFFVLLLGWSAFRLINHDDGLARIIDVAFVVVAGLLEPLIVSADISDASMSATRAIAYPVLVAAGVVWVKRWSFAVMIVTTVAAMIGDLILFGRPDISLAALVFSWAAATWVHGLIQGAAANTDAAAAEAHRAQIREQVAVARIRFEREQFAMLHDTAASTLMMVGDSNSLDPKRLAAQAARDIDLLTNGKEVGDPDWEIDLRDQIKAVAREFRIPVEIRQPEGPVFVVAPIAASSVGATREALNNIDRHSRATKAIITIRPGSLSIADDGIGFDPDARSGFGMRFSIEGRMQRAGGTATIRSTRGAGTVVDLEWTVLPSERVGRTVDVARVGRGFQYGLIAASFLVNIEMMILGFGGLLDSLTVLSALIITMLFVSDLVAIIVVRTGFESLRWVWVTVLFVGATARVATLPPGLLNAVPNWVAIAVGWAMVAFLSGWVTTLRRTVLASGLIVAYWLVRAVIRIWRLPTSEIIEYAGYGLASVATMQAAAIACAWVLAEAVHVAAKLGEQQRAAATHRAVEEAVQEDYRRHFASLTADIVGLLRGIADGSMPVDRPAVRDRAHVEYARLRRLFAQAESFEHPLMLRLRPLVDEAAQRNVDITLDVQSRPPDLDERDLDTVATAVGRLIDGAQERIRLVVSSNDGHVTVSVVSDSTDDVRSHVRDALADGDYQLTVHDSVTWLRVNIPAMVAA